MSAPFDLAARRAALPRDAVRVIRELDDGAASLLSTFAGWPYTHLRAHHVDAAERQLQVLHRLLAELRAFMPADRDAS